MQSEEKGLYSILGSPSGEYIAFVVDGITLWRDAGGKFEKVDLVDSHSGIRAASFSPDSRRLASILNTGQMQTWSTETGRIIQTVQFEQPYSFSACSISNSLGRLVVADKENVIRLYTTADQNLVDTNPYEAVPSGPLKLIELSPNQGLLVTASDLNTLQVWDAATGKPIGKEMIGHADAILSMAFSPDSCLVASGSYDGSLKLWAVPEGEERLLDSTRRANEPIADIVFSPNGEMLAAGWEVPGLINIWNIASQNSKMPIHCLECRDNLASLAFSCDSELSISAQRRCIEIHHVSDGSVMSRVEHSFNAPQMVALTSGKDRVAMLYGIGAGIAIWDIQGVTRQIANLGVHGDWSHSYFSIAPNDFLVFGIYVWEIGPVDTRPIHALTSKLPSGLRDSTSNPRSLLSFRDGWIYSTLVGGKLLAVPRHLGVGPYATWSARGNVIAFLTGTGKPLIIDCSQMLEGFGLLDS
jgi:WD40 repeat protein